MKKFNIYIIIAWSVLIFIGYNVLSAEAVNLNKEYTWTGPDGHKDKVTLNDFELEDIPHTCNASEDYTRNEKLCNVLHDWEEEEKEIAAKEDVICDNEDADSTSIELCKSEDRKNNQQKNEREWYYNENTNQYEYLSDEEIKEHNMEAESEIMQGEKWGPETPIEPPSEPYPTTEEEVIEDWSNTVSDTDDEFQKQQEHFEARAESNSNSENLPEVVEKIVSEQKEEEDEPEEDEDEPEEEEDDNSNSESEE